MYSYISIFFVTNYMKSVNYFSETFQINMKRYYVPLTKQKLTILGTDINYENVTFIY